MIGMAVTETQGYNMAFANAGMSPADFTGLTTTAGFQMGAVAPASKGLATFDDMIAAAKAGEPIRFGAMSPDLADLADQLGKARPRGWSSTSNDVRSGKAVMDGVNAGDMDVSFMAGLPAKGVAAGDLVNLSAPLAKTPDTPTFADLGLGYNSDR